MSFALFFDITIAFLLLTTIVFAVLLNRKLSLIHNRREELQSLLDHFSKSLHRAEDGLMELRKAAHSIGDSLDAHIKKAGTLKDDLVFLIERGESLANQLEEGIRTSRPLAKKPTSSTHIVADSTAPVYPEYESEESQDTRLARMLEGLR